MLDKVRLAVADGYRVALVYCVRNRELVKLEPISGCEIFPHSVPHRGVEISRLLHFPQFAWWLRKNIFRHAEQGCRIQTDSLDMLALAQLASSGKRARFHHMVRDLHSLQLGRGLLPTAVRLADRVLLRRITMLMLTCPGYFEHYYSHFYRGRVSIVENWPDLDVWDGFQRKRTDDFTIGFVGVVRYLDCLKALIYAIDQLRSEGRKVQLRIAGGGELEHLLAETGPREWIDYRGPFSYRDQIQQLYSDVDVIWSVYDARITNVRYALPNKFYESILSGIPMVVAEGTYLAQRVEETGNGTSVPGLDPAGIASKLRAAFDQDSWYTQAEAILPLRKAEALGYLQHEHRNRIREAVLGQAIAAHPTRENAA